MTVFEPPHRFEFTATGGPGGTSLGHPHRHDFLFTPENGGTRIELRRTDPAPNVLFAPIGPIVLRAVRGIRMRTVDNLRSRLEQLPAGQPE